MTPGQHDRPAPGPDQPATGESVGAAFARVVVPGALYGLDLATHVVALLLGAHTLATVTQALLMPLLAAVLLGASTRPLARVTRWALAALALSWLGDVLPSTVGGDADDLRFLLMVGPFLLAQTAYVTAFRPYRRRVRPLTVAGYAVALAVLVGVCAPHAGTMLVPVLVYGAMLTAMAVLSTGLGRLAGLGGAVFFVSDGLIALGRFAGHPAGTAGSVAVMATYGVGQALLVAGVLHRAGDMWAAPRSKHVPRPSGAVPGVTASGGVAERGGEL